MNLTQLQEKVEKEFDEKFGTDELPKNDFTAEVLTAYVKELKYFLHSALQESYEAGIRAAREIEKPIGTRLFDMLREKEHLYEAELKSKKVDALYVAMEAVGTLLEELIKTS